MHQRQLFKAKDKNECNNQFYCPGKKAAVVIIVVSLPCTAYQCGSFIAF